MASAPPSSALRASRLAIGGLLLVLLLARAAAAPWRDDLDGAKTALQQRYSVLPEPSSKEEARRLAALEKCFRILGATSTSDEKDLSVAATLAKTGGSSRGRSRACWSPSIRSGSPRNWRRAASRSGSRSGNRPSRRGIPGAPAGEASVRIHDPGKVRGGAEYVAVCVPAFSPDTVHRDGPG